MNDKLNDALSEVKEEYIAQAASYKRRRLPRWIGVAAAAVAWRITQRRGATTSFMGIRWLPPVT